MCAQRACVCLFVGFRVFFVQLNQHAIFAHYQILVSFAFISSFMLIYLVKICVLSNMCMYFSCAC